VGCDRLILAFMCDAYREEITVDDKGQEDVRLVMGFHPEIAPFKAAILPLSKKGELTSVADKLRDQLAEDFDVTYDETGSIGKRYRRQDEIGTPFCITVDFETVNDQAVTVRHRDTMVQERVPMAQLNAYVAAKIKGFKLSKSF
jgi:glycyl-tRNA synthetase